MMQTLFHSSDQEVNAFVENSAYSPVSSKYQTAITALGQWALSGIDLPILFQDTALLVARVLQVQYSHVWQVLSDSHSLRKVACTQGATTADHSFEVSAIAHPWVRHLLETKEPILIQSTTLTQEADLPMPIPSDSVCGISLLIPGQDRPLGVIEAYSTEPRQFSSDDVHFLQAVTHVLSTAIERQRSDSLMRTQRQVLEQVAISSNLYEIFNSLCVLLEQQLPGAYCSILVLDQANQQLRGGAAPTLPPEFAKGVDGLLIGECAGSCGTAAYRGEAVFVADIATDPLWAPFRDFALSHGIQACWSTPFISQAGEVLGTFALSHRVPCQPTQHHKTILQTAAHLASIATETCRAAAALRRANSELESKVEERTLELKTALQCLQQTQAQLVQTEKMSSLGQMVAGIAHEINNPISFITGNLNHAEQYVQDLLDLVAVYQEEYPHPDSRVATKIAEVDLEFLRTDLPKLLGSMRMGGDRIRNIVLGLRNFSRLDEADMKAVDIHEGLESTLMIVQHQLAGNGNLPEIKLIKDYGQLPWIHCYASQLNQVFMNILSNAIDALHSRYGESPSLPGSTSSEYASLDAGLMTYPWLKIQTRLLESDRVQIIIADNGMGIAEEAQTRIFDPFFTTKALGKGTGLGLSISYTIIEKHQGTLSCRSTPGQGTEFIIELPIG